MVRPRRAVRSVQSRCRIHWRLSAASGDLAPFAINRTLSPVPSGDASWSARPILEFWYDFASTYSYLAAMRIEAAADGAGVERAVAAVPARADLRGARAGTRRPSTSFPTRAATCGGTWSARRPACGSRSTGPNPFRRTACSRLASAFLAPKGLDAGLHAGGLHGGIRRGAGHRRACGDPGDARSARSRRPRPLSPKPGRTPTSCGSSEPARTQSSVASSARPPSSPRMARCSGATTAWSRQSPGHLRPHGRMCRSSRRRGLAGALEQHAIAF